MANTQEASWSELLSGRNGLRSLALAGGVAVHAINVYVATTILPSVVEDIGGLEYYAWNTTLFVVASILGSALSPQVLEKLGLRHSFLVSLLFFAIGTTLCAAAPSMPFLLFARTIQGLGGGLPIGACITTDARSAEMTKLVENAYRDVNIAFANELSIIAERQGIDVWELIELANHHPRVNVLQPGPGVGGHCIAVDPWFIVSSAPEQSQLIRTAREVNDSKPQYVIAKVLEAVEGADHHGHREGPRAGCAGRTAGWRRRLHRKTLQFEGAVRAGRAGPPAGASCHNSLRLS